MATWTDPQHIGGRTIYQSFKYSEFAPMPGELISNKRLFETYSYSCKITNAIESQIEIEPPSIAGNDVLVWDHRFNNIGVSTIVYAATNGWISKADLLPLATKSRKVTFEQEVVENQGFGQKNSQRTTTRHIIWLAMALPFTIVLLKGVVRMKKERKNPNESK